MNVGEPIDFAQRRAQPRKVELSCAPAQEIKLARDSVIMPPPITLARGFRLVVVLLQTGKGGHAVRFDDSGFRDAPALGTGAPGTRAGLLFAFDDVAFQFIGGARGFA